MHIPSSSVQVLPGLSLYELLCIPLYLSFIYILAFAITGRYPRESPLRKYLIAGLSFKIIGGLSFAAVYMYYYKDIRGDTFYYWDGALAVREAFVDSPILGLKTLFVPAGKWTLDTLPYTIDIPGFYLSAGEMTFMSKIVGVIAYLCLGSYWLSTIVIATISFSGIWKLYQGFRELLPHRQEALFWATVMVPSTLFWGSGMVKDALTIGALGWLFYALQKIFNKRSELISSLLIILICSWVIFQLKAYILFSFIPPAAVYVYLKAQPKSGWKGLYWASSPFLIPVFMLSGYLIIMQLQDASELYNLQVIKETAEGFHTDHQEKTELDGQTGYNLGPVEYTPAGLLAKFPAAVNVAFFRPYPWEVREPMQFLTAFESLLMLLLTFYIVARIGPWRFLVSIMRSPEGIFCLLFVLLFGFAVGFTAYNFGALARFRIPAVPFLFTLLVIVWDMRRPKIKAKNPV
jgi:hypothetical protein